MPKHPDGREPVSAEQARSYGSSTLLMLIVLVAFVAMLSIGALTVSLSVRSLSQTADRNARLAQQAVSATTRLQDQSTSVCRAANEYFTNDRARWQFIINLSSPPTDQAARDRLDRFKQYINVADHLRTCP